MHATERIMLLATALLGIVAIVPWTTPEARYVALGALAGLVGGHLNGRLQRAASTSS